MKRAILAVAAVAAVIGIAGCGPSHHHSLAKARASASALASNPAIVADKAKAKAEVLGCISKVGVLNIAGNPHKGSKAVVDCLHGYAVNKATFDAQAQALILRNGFTSTSLQADEIGLANLLVSK